MTPKSKAKSNEKPGNDKKTEDAPEKIAKKAINKYKNVLKMNEGTYPYQPGEGHLGKHRAKSKRVRAELGKYSLTEKQKKVLNFVSHHISSVGFPPTVRQIAVYFGVSAKAAHDHLRAIAKKGYLRLFPGSARGMEVVNNPYGDDPNGGGTPSAKNIVEEIQSVPLVGSIAAGVPMLAEENVEKNIPIPKSFLPTTGTMFALRVKGDSMEGAGILDGDVAVLQQVHDVFSEVTNGDIVAALVDGEATLKTYQKVGARLQLIPENPRYKPIKLAEKDNATIVGKLVGVYRKY